MESKPVLLPVPFNPASFSLAQVSLPSFACRVLHNIAFSYFFPPTALAILLSSLFSFPASCTLPAPFPSGFPRPSSPTPQRCTLGIQSFSPASTVLYEYHYLIVIQVQEWQLQVFPWVGEGGKGSLMSTGRRQSFSLGKLAIESLLFRTKAKSVISFSRDSWLAPMYMLLFFLVFPREGKGVTGILGSSPGYPLHYR